jgi:multidrug efflux pump subunit AcrA (membrane-fusion protein)
VPGLNDRQFSGRVAMSSWSLDPQTRALRTEIDFDNEGGALRPGMYAHARLGLTQPGAWTVPASAVFILDGQAYVWQAVGGKAHRVPVRLGAKSGGDVQLLKKKTGDPAVWVDIAGTEELLTGPPQRPQGRATSRPDAPVRGRGEARRIHRGGSEAGGH